MDDLIGRTLGPYQITQPLGRGGMAAVYKAYQPALQRYVAIKILPASLAHDPQFSERFTREARAIARLDHPNILPVYDFGQSDGVTYIVMKYVDGGTLKDVLERGKMPFDQAALILGQVASALDYAHGQGVIHRDIKPANILLARPDWALLSDFGLAKVTESAAKLTGTGVGMGTPEYMAPEQASGLEIDARADIYSLGVTLYAMVTGEVPYTGSTPIAIILKHVNDPLPSPRAVNPAIPFVAETAILKAMAKKPAERYPSASELSRAFGAAVGAKPQVEATRLEVPGAPITEKRPTAGATILEPPPSAVREVSPTMPPPAAWPPAAPPPVAVAPPPAKKGGISWVWIAGAAVAFVCLLLVVGSVFLGGMVAIFGSTATPEPPTPFISTSPAPTSVPTLPPIKTTAPGAGQFGPITFAVGVLNDETPVDPLDTFPDGVTIVYAFFDYSQMGSGQAWRTEWLRDGQVQSDIGKQSDWTGGANGAWWVSLFNKDGIPTGQWQLKLYLDNQLQQSATFAVEPNPSKQPDFGPITFAPDKDANEKPLNPVSVSDPTFPAGTINVYAFFDGIDVPQGTDWTSQWFLNGTSQTDPKSHSWTFAPNENEWLSFGNKDGSALEAGTYELKLVIGSRLVNVGTFIVSK
ncbi:MAG: serine/threonine protein kinase [Chloroflexi bacterium]|nr:serine/threonine protein kinase [Chloroflexota bacterium]